MNDEIEDLLNKIEEIEADKNAIKDALAPINAFVLPQLADQKRAELKSALIEDMEANGEVVVPRKSPASSVSVQGAATALITSLYALWSLTTQPEFSADALGASAGAVIAAAWGVYGALRRKDLQP